MSYHPLGEYCAKTNRDIADEYNKQMTDEHIESVFKAIQSAAMHGHYMLNTSLDKSEVKRLRELNYKVRQCFGFSGFYNIYW